MELGFSPLSAAPLDGAQYSTPPPATGTFQLGMIGSCGSGCGCSSDCCLCQSIPCSIPRKNLSISWVNSLSGNGSDTLVNLGNSWAPAGCSGNFGELNFRLVCTNGGLTQFYVYYYTSGGCPNGTQASCGNILGGTANLVFAGSACYPFVATFETGSAKCPTVFGNGYTSFTVADTSPTPNLMCQQFCFLACGEYTGGITITVYDSTSTAVAIGVTNSAGCVWLSWVGSPGSYTVTTSLGPSGSYTLTCAGTTTIGCPPLPNTLYLTDANETITLTKDISGVWRGCYTLAVGDVWTTSTVGTNCVASDLGGGQIPIGYAASCVTSGGKFVVTRFWPALNDRFGNPHYLNQYPPGLNTPFPCAGVSSACSLAMSGPANPFQQISVYDSQIPTECYPSFSWTGGSYSGTNTTVDPVGGSVTVTS